MEITGKIIAVLQPRNGVSKTGTPWIVQEYVIEETSGQYPRKVAFEVFGDDKIKQFSIRQGVEYRVSFDIDAREWNGRYFNSVRAWKVVPVQPTQSVSPTPNTEVFPSAVNENGVPADNDSLPF